MTPQRQRTVAGGVRRAKAIGAVPATHTTIQRLHLLIQGILVPLQPPLHRHPRCPPAQRISGVPVVGINGSIIGNVSARDVYGLMFASGKLHLLKMSTRRFLQRLTGPQTDIRTLAVCCELSRGPPPCPVFLPASIILPARQVPFVAAADPAAARKRRHKA